MVYGSPFAIGLEHHSSNLHIISSLFLQFVAVKYTFPLSEIINVPDSKSKEKLLNNIHELLKKRSTGNDLVLLLVALKNIIIAPGTAPVISNRLQMTEYREALVLEFSDLDFVKVRNIQIYFKNLYYKDAKGKRVIDNSWYKQELQFIKDDLLK